MKHVAADDNDLMDLVDSGDQVIGLIYQKDAPELIKTKAGFVRGTVAFVQNDKGQLWVPRRVASKRVAPSGIDFSVAEHVQKNETYEQGIIRGFKEELFLDVSKNDLKLLGKLGPIPVLPYFFMAVFLYKANELKEYNLADYTGYQWLYPQQVIDLIKQGEPHKSAMIEAINSFILS